MTQKLNQVIAVEKGIKERANRAITDQYHVGQKIEPFTGLSRSYKPKTDGGDPIPAESKLVQMNARDVLKGVRKQMTELFDITAAKDFANCTAKADISVNGSVILADVPATFLMFIEKQLEHIHTIVTKLPTLSADEDWTLDVNTSLYKSRASESTRTSKEVVPIVKYDATDKHPAQTDLITKDLVVGTWTTIKISGAMPVPEKELLLDRVERLQRAVKYAREQANMAEAPAIEAGAAVLGWLFKEGV